MNIMQLWGDKDFRNVRSLIGEHFPMGILYGGFLRDLVLGRSFNDVDVMVEQIPVIAGDITWFDNDDERYLHQNVVGQARVELEGYQFNFIQFMAFDDVESVVSQVDFGLCRIGWSLREGLVVTNEFIGDVANQQITNFRTGWGETGVRAHYERIKEKYQWPLVGEPVDKD